MHYIITQREREIAELKAELEKLRNFHLPKIGMCIDYALEFVAEDVLQLGSARSYLRTGRSMVTEQESAEHSHLAQPWRSSARARANLAPHPQE